MELSSVLAQIDFLKQEADSLLPVKPEFERVFWEKFRLEFNYNSNHMEGNTLTYGQTKLLLLFDRTTGDNKGREIEEMKAHDVALKMVNEISSDPETALTEKIIREINEIILVRPFYNNAITPGGQPTKRLITPGAYKKHPNSVLLPDGSMFYYASPEETPALMGDLIEWYNQNKKIIHPVRLAALMHYKLVRIHPFDDSNGRTTRLIMNFILMQNGFAPLVIESKKKDDYLAALNKADVGNIDSFEGYIAEVSARWQELYLKALKGEKIEEAEDFDKEVEVMKKELQGKEGLKTEISDTIVKEVFYDSVLSLAKNVEQKLNQFSDLFFKTEINIKGSSHFESFDTLDRVENSFGSFINNLKDGGKLSIEFTQFGFKKAGTNAFDCYSGFDINFQKYKYEILIKNSNEFKIEKLYHEKISNTEIDLISRKIARARLEEIKERTKL